MIICHHPEHVIAARRRHPDAFVLSLNERVIYSPGGGRIIATRRRIDAITNDPEAIPYEHEPEQEAVEGSRTDPSERQVPETDPAPAPSDIGDLEGTIADEPVDVG